VHSIHGGNHRQQRVRSVLVVKNLCVCVFRLIGKACGVAAKRVNPEMWDKVNCTLIMYVIMHLNR
jgi:hypothetical protein